jgi:hypothetical protein
MTFPRHSAQGTDPRMGDSAAPAPASLCGAVPGGSADDFLSGAIHKERTSRGAIVPARGVTRLSGSGAG